MRCPWTVGRRAERELLLEAVAAAAAGRGGTVVLLGEPGIGKSRLVADLAPLATNSGLAQLAGRCVRTGPGVPLRPFAEALGAAVRAYGEPRTPGLRPFRPVLGRLVPQWRVPDADTSPVALAEGVLRFLRAIGAEAAGPAGTVLVLDDLQWADPETLAVVEYLADNLAGERTLLVCAAREEPPTAAALAEALRARGAAQVVRVPRLDAQDLPDLVRGCLGLFPGRGPTVPDDVVALAARAEGHPYLVEELLADAVAAGVLVADGASWRLAAPFPAVVPGTVACDIAGRLATLGPAARAVVPAAAVLGDSFDWTLLPQVAGLDEAAVLAGLREAVAARLLVPGSGGAEDAFRFRHNLTRDAVLAGLLPPERAGLAVRAMAAYDARPGVEPDPAVSTFLATAAGELGRAAVLLVRMGVRAIADGALGTAEAALRRALELDPETPGARPALVEALSLAGRWSEARAAGAGPGGSPEAVADLQLALARAAVTAADWTGAREHARLARSSADDRALRARADAVEALAALGADLPGAAVALAAGALAAAEETGLAEVACEALEVLGRSERWRDLAAAERAFGRALHIAEANGLPLWQVRALHELGTIDLLERCDVGRLQAARELAAGLGALARVADLDVQIAAGLVGADDPEPALEVAARAADLAHVLGLRPTEGVAHGFAATAYARAGREEQMGAELARLHALLPDSPDAQVLAAGAHVYLAFARDDPAEALRVLDASPPAAGSPPFAGVHALLTAVRRDDDARTADVRARGEPVHLVGRAYLRYAEAVAAGRAGAPEPAAAHLAAGDAALGSLTWFRHYGRRLVASAALAAGWGDPVAWLREAQDFFAAAGSERPAAGCRALLRGAGVAVRRRGRGGTAVPEELRALGVTAREADVLSALAAGGTDREIAAQLVLSPRTVQTHVASLLAKTGCANRRDLARLARRALTP